MSKPTETQSVINQVLVIHKQDSVKKARSIIANNTPASINYIYVVNSNQQLEGVVSIRELFLASPEQTISRIMQRQLITVRPTTSPTRAAYLALKHNIKSIPVVDKNNVLQKVFESDEILRLLYQDFRQDLLRLSGIIPSTSTSQAVRQTNFWQSLRGRLPWIIFGLIGGAFIAQFLQAFEEVLLTDIMFVPFIPLIVYIANAVGIQTQTLYIRDEAQEPSIKTYPFLLRQLAEGVGIGLFTWLSLAIITFISWGSARLGLIIGLAMNISILVSIVQAVGIPYALIKLKKDPAIGSGPFATLLQDFTSVAIYILVVATLA
jgi:magnesium transporter